MARRSQIIAKFRGDEIKLRVLLINYKVAASGMNLIEASHIFLLRMKIIDLNNIIINF